MLAGGDAVPGQGPHHHMYTDKRVLVDTTFDSFIKLLGMWQKARGRAAPLGLWAWAGLVAGTAFGRALLWQRQRSLRDPSPGVQQFQPPATSQNLRLCSLVDGGLIG